MIAADRPVQRPPEARLLVMDAEGVLSHRPRAHFVQQLRPGDLVIANDAATLPASLHGTHLRTGASIELRLAARRSLAPRDVNDWQAVVFGEGDHRTRTEDRPAPPALLPGDLLMLGGAQAPLYATVLQPLDHARFVALRLHGKPEAVWAGLARHGKPVQYAHLREPLHLWDVWTAIAGVPAALEPPSAGFALDWAGLQAMRERGVAFATLTHAAGLSSTGDPALDARLPLPEPYMIPADTVRAVHAAWARGGRIVAVGTTVVRALEHAAARSRGGGLPPGSGLATQKIGPGSVLQVVDVLLSGTHEPGTSHHALLGAFADAERLRRIDDTLASHGYRTHEFGDSVWLERQATAAAHARPQQALQAA
ncbi:MAG: S-adenosylmethionine:tRNA ribosyltransferase-isomerase [Pseudomonadota bacterium]